MNPAPTNVLGAPRFFLKIAEIKGEARAKAHDAETELLSWTWGETQSVFPSEARKSGGSVSMSDFEFTAINSSASSQFLLHCAAAKVFKTAVLTCESELPNRGRHTYLTITLSNVVISSYEIAATPDALLPVDSVSLKFTKIEFVYTPAGGGNFSCTWDLSLSAKA